MSSFFYTTSSHDKGPFFDTPGEALAHEYKGCVPPPQGAVVRMLAARGDGKREVARIDYSAADILELMLLAQNGKALLL